MRKLVFFLAAITIAPNVAHTQVTLDMTRITCADYLGMPAEQALLFSAWMSGWYNHMSGYSTVGLGDFKMNIANVRQWCAGSPRETVMSGLDRSRSQQGLSDQIKFDMSLMTCKQYLSSDSERQNTIAYWLNGYFRASRNQPVVDFPRFANNKKSLGAHCRKNGGETLMSAIQKTAR